jgi:hypothetical protein
MKRYYNANIPPVNKVSLPVVAAPVESLDTFHTMIKETGDICIAYAKIAVIQLVTSHAAFYRCCYIILTYLESSC